MPCLGPVSLRHFAPKVPDMRAPEMCGVIKSDGKTKWFPRTDEVRDGAGRHVAVAGASGC